MLILLYFLPRVCDCSLILTTCPLAILLQWCGIELPLRVWGARSSASITVHSIALSICSRSLQLPVSPCLECLSGKMSVFHFLRSKGSKSPLLSFLRRLVLILPTLARLFNPSLLLLLGYNSASLLMRLPSLPDCEPLWEYQQLLLLYFYPPAPNILPGMCWLLNYYLLNWLMLL